MENISVSTAFCNFCGHNHGKHVLKAVLYKRLCSKLLSGMFSRMVIAAVRLFLQHRCHELLLAFGIKQAVAQRNSYCLSPLNSINSAFVASPKSVFVA